MKNELGKLSISEILSAPIMQATVRNVLGNEQYNIVERPGTYILTLNEEPKDYCKRIILLKPQGFTSNNLNELSSHPEASEAVIEIKGAVRPQNKGYFHVKNCVEYIYLNKDDVKTSPDYPYANAEGAMIEIKTSRTKFKAVKRNYYGFYHNLTNLTNEWLVLILNKKLNLSKQIDHSIIENSGKMQRRSLQDLIDKVSEEGDSVFKNNPAVVERIYSMNPSTSIPALITLLNMDEKGKHEQCTIFAIILKISKKHQSLARKLLQKAEKEESASPFYIHELIRKIKNK